MPDKTSHILTEQEKADGIVECQFCNQYYGINQSATEKMLAVEPNPKSHECFGWFQPTFSAETVAKFRKPAEKGVKRGRMD